MCRLWAIKLVWLICGVIAVCEPVFGATSDSNCNWKTCNGTMYDTRKDVCCGKRLHSGDGLSCCGDESFSPAKATCCKSEHGNEFKVTQGLSAKVSTCCGLEAFNALNEICCGSTVVAKQAAMADCCGNEAYDVEKKLCCGPMDDKKVLVKESTNHQCCGHNQCNTKTHFCHWENQTHPNEEFKQTSYCVLKSVPTSPAICGGKPYDEHKYLCCNSTIITKPSSNAECCGKMAYDVEKKLCCGPLDDKKVLVKESTHHQCCGHNQCNTKTHFCRWKNQIHPNEEFKQSSYCVLKSDGQHQNPEPQPNCIEPHTHLCGSRCYNPNEHRCCERTETKSLRHCPSGKMEREGFYFSPCRTVWCPSCPCLPPEKFPDSECCGDAPYGSAQCGFLCCHNGLHKDREDREECSDTSIPYNPAKGTICCFQFRGSSGLHCCGPEVYQPHNETCCGGHRYRKDKNLHCCGVKAYNIKDPKMKCCAGMLHNLTPLGNHKGDMKCCGSVLQNPQDEVCCSSKDEVVLYSRKTGFGCCGHLHYNLSLWSCRAGRLSPGQSKMTESRIQSENNLNEAHLCMKIYIGIVKSVSLNSIVFGNVLEIHARNATVQPVPLHYFLTDHHNAPKLTLGKFYLFNDSTVFADFIHDNVLESLYFIFIKCSP